MLLFGGLRTIFNCWMPLELVPTLITMCFSVLQAPGDCHQSQYRKTHPARAPESIFVILASNQFESLPIQMNHVLQVSALPNHHRDLIVS